MQPKKKKCKANGKAKGVVESCGELHSPDTNLSLPNYGLCSKCKRKFYFETDVGQAIKEQKALSNIKKVQKEKKAKHAKAKKERKSIQELIQEARRPFQWLIRVRDIGKQCICCDKFLGWNTANYDAGHYLKAEKYTALIFHPDNVHGQTVGCNHYQHGNESGYTEGLKKRIGIERFEELHRLKIKHQNFKPDRSFILELKKHYSAEKKAVEKGIKCLEAVDFSKGIIN